jgi:hypothetical protein
MKNDLRSFWQLISINYKEFIREPGILFWSLAFPVLMAWVLGIAFSKKTELVQPVAYVKSGDEHHEKLAVFLDSSNHYFRPDSSIKEYHRTYNSKMGKLTFG